MFKNTCKTVYSLREHLAVVRRRSRRLVYYCVQRAATIYDPILILCIFPAKQCFSEWAMLGSNQRPLPCKAAYGFRDRSGAVRKSFFKAILVSFRRQCSKASSRVTVRTSSGGVLSAGVPAALPNTAMVVPARPAVCVAILLVASGLRA